MWSLRSPRSVPRMPDQAYPTKYDRITIIAVSALGCILQDVLHEGLGHGVTAWLSGAHRLTISTVALQSDIETRWISAAGTLVNLFTAAILWLLLSRAHTTPIPATSLFWHSRETYLLRLVTFSFPVSRTSATGPP